MLLCDETAGETVNLNIMYWYWYLYRWIKWYTEEVTELTQFFTVFIETCWEWKSWLWATLSNYFYGYWILTSDPDLKSANVEIRRKLERDFFLRAFRPCASQGMVFQLPQTLPQGRLVPWRLGDENSVIYHWYIWGSRTQKNSINTGDYR